MLTRLLIKENLHYYVLVIIKLMANYLNTKDNLKLV